MNMKKQFILFIVILLCLSCGNKRMARLNESVQEGSSLPASEKRWELAELNGHPVTDTLAGKAFIELDTEVKRVSGNAGCNTFSGNLRMSDENSIRISEVIATKMACENMETEYGLFEVFKETRGYSLGNDTLALFDGEGKTLAKFFSGE